MKTELIAINAKYIHTNLAIRYLYTYTRASHDVNFIEFTIKDDITRITNNILESKPDLIGFSCYIWNIELIKQIIVEIKNISPSTKILLGGPEVSYDVSYWFNSLPIDYLISGEGEYSFKLLLDKLTTNSSLSEIPQFHYRQDKKVISNISEYIISLDELNSPYRLKNDIDNLSNRITYIESSRGCPYKCSYCLASLENHVRYFDINFIKEEIIYLMNHGAKIFKFLDRTFNARIKYALDLFKFIIKHHQKNCVFQFEITGDLLDEEIINFLNTFAPEGLFRFEIGVQSTNELTNQLILRNQNLEKLKNNIKLIQKGKKIILHLDLIAGLPKEDYKSFIKTFNDVFILRPHELQLGFLKMLRGTKLRKDAEIYHYNFNALAPYEIIDNKDLSISEKKKIQACEEMLEKYYNSHRFDKSINYIIETYFQFNNYKFFEKFGLYYNLNYSLINHQTYDLCVRLLDFLATEKINSFHINSLIIYDYLHIQKTRPKIWYDTQITKQEKRTVFGYVVKHQDFSSDFLYRYALVEKLTINPENYEIGSFYLVKLFSHKNQDILIINKDNLEN